MKHQNYLKLSDGRIVNPANDPEGPTVIATALKIMKYSGLDEAHETPCIVLYFSYGFVNSKNEFKILEPLVYTEVVTDIEEQIVDNKATGKGINALTKQSEQAGRWLSQMLEVTEDQKDRTYGDFRVYDLYVHLIQKYNIKGEIVSTDDKPTGDKEIILIKDPKSKLRVIRN